MYSLMRDISCRSQQIEYDKLSLDSSKLPQGQPRGSRAAVREEKGNPSKCVRTYIATYIQGLEDSVFSAI